MTKEAFLQGIRHLFQVAGGAAEHLALFVPVEIAQRQAVQFRADFLSERQRQRLGNAGHGVLLDVGKQRGQQVQSQQPEQDRPHRFQIHLKSFALCNGVLNAGKDLVDRNTDSLWRQYVESRADDDAEENDQQFSPLRHQLFEQPQCGAPGILGPLCAHIAVKAVRSGFAGIFFHIHAHANSSSLSCERAIC